MIFLFMKSQLKCDQIVICPVNYCGYGTLINSDPKKANCAALSVNINGISRIIIHTTRKIFKG